MIKLKILYDDGRRFFSIEPTEFIADLTYHDGEYQTKIKEYLESEGYKLVELRTDNKAVFKKVGRR